MKKHLLVMLLSALPLACSTGPKIKASEQPVLEPPTKTLESQYGASAENADAVGEVDFAKGSTKLAAPEIEKLRKEIAFARKRGIPAEAKIIAWADREYPAAQSRPLPASANKLAQRRAEEVRKTIASLAGLPAEKTKTYTMTARPKTLDSLVHPTETKLKRDFEEAGLNGKDPKVSHFAGKVIVLLQNEAPEASDTTPGTQQR